MANFHSFFNRSILQSQFFNLLQMILQNSLLPEREIQQNSNYPFPTTIPKPCPCIPTPKIPVQIFNQINQIQTTKIHTQTTTNLTIIEIHRYTHPKQQNNNQQGSRAHQQANPSAN